MRLAGRLAAWLVAGVALLFAMQLHAAESVDVKSREAIEQVIREYLLRNPEIIHEALEALRVRQREAEQQRVRGIISDRRDELFRDPRSPVGGNPSGDVTVVEFFDYRCGYCKSVAGTVNKLVDEDRNIRFVYKEFPILGPESVIAARAALAAQQQGRYKVFHDALMAASAPLTETAVFETAAQLGLDVGKLRTDMRAPAIEAAIDANYRLARLLGVNGTPAFIIGTELVPGAVDLSTLQELVAKARQK